MLPWLLVAQNSSNEAQANLNHVAGSAPRVVLQTFDSRYEGVRGSPYLYPVYPPGLLRFNTGKTAQALVNYDTYHHELVLQLSNRTIAIDYRTLRGFALHDTLGDTLQFVKSYALPSAGEWKVDSAEFLQVLHQGGLTLVAQHRKNFMAASYQGAYSANKPYDQYDDLPKRYYVLREGLAP